MRIWVCLFLFLCSSCLAGTIDPSVPDEKYLEYGSQHECVVPITVMCDCGKKEGPHEMKASAVVISPRWILTAAHVVEGKRDARVKVRGEDFPLKVVFDKRFNRDKLYMYDLALGESDRDMRLDFYPELYEKKDEVGKAASICGYGLTGTFGSGSVKPGGIKRAGSNIVDKASDHVIFCSVSGGRRTSMEFLISKGDSGGGLFIDQKLAGINSFINAPDGKYNSNYGDESAHTRISLFIPWIRAHMKGENPPED